MWSRTAWFGMAWMVAASFAWGEATVNLAAAGRLESDLARDATSHPVEVIQFAGVTDGMQIADVFGGSGYYSELISQIVGPTGHVVLHNNAAYLPYIGEQLEKRMAGDRLSNVERVVRESDDLQLGKDTLDGVFLVQAFHDFWLKEKDWTVTAEQVLPQLRAALKPGGFVLLEDHAAADGTGASKAEALHRIDEAFVKEKMKEYGFELVKESQILRNPLDTREVTVFDESIRRKTDRFLHLYKSAD